MRPSRFDAKTLSLTASLAAVYTVFRLIPLSKFIGTTGFLTASGMVTPIIGVLIEPEYGILSVFIGTMVASFAPWNPLRFAGLDFLPGALNLLVVSLAVRGKRIEAGLILASTIAIFSLTPNTIVFVGSNLESPPLPFFWLHLSALAILISPLGGGVVNRMRSLNYSQIALSVGIVAFAGTMTEHITGGMLYALFFGPGIVKFWPGIYLVYPIERTVIIVGSVLVSSPLIKFARTFRDDMMLRSTRASLGLEK